MGSEVQRWGRERYPLEKEKSLDCWFLPISTCHWAEGEDGGEATGETSLWPPLTQPVGPALARAERT